MLPFDGDSTRSGTVGGTDELLWQAFRYVSEEMTEDEAEAFEVELTENLAACEAVARAVQIRQAVVAVERETVKRSDPAVPSRKAAAIIARVGPSLEDLTWSVARFVAAGLVIAFGLGLWFAGRAFDRNDPVAKGNRGTEGRSPSVAPSVDDCTREARELLSLWRDPAHPVLEHLAASHPSTMSDDDEGEIEAMDAEDAQLADSLVVLDPVPDWMLAALDDSLGETGGTADETGSPTAPMARPDMKLPELNRTLPQREPN
ncbi:MAG: hypothetical protein IT428_17740 [Planctomycetaceae bacterium]|nr:hypothetical protein [Planctomycetaceae bacterium]